MLFSKIILKIVKLLRYLPVINSIHISAMKFKVAEHIFEIEGVELYDVVADKLEGPYGPFMVDSGSVSDDMLFSLTLCDEVQNEDAELVYSNKDSVEQGFIVLSVYKNESGHYFEFTQPGLEVVNGCLWISTDYSQAKMSLAGSELAQWLTFNTGVNFCFLLATAKHDTVLAHSSCVVYKDKAYLFLGKSGTGKSTHSRMWLNALENVVLMNDDHPVIRVNEDGQAIAYGSPWSGKTPCYKNMQAPIGGIIRIVRAPYNKARRLSIIESYASLMTSFSGMTWEKDLADGRDKTIQGIIKSVPCWAMECLPDVDAARVCSKAVAEV